MSPLDEAQGSGVRSNVSSWWGAATAEALYRLGVRTLVVSPGSRSTPLTYACAAHRGLDCRVILDERSAGFFALGLARARQAPVGLICTSGSAVVQYLPAVVEAHESGVGLLLLTADRPPELRHRQAGQTIDQLKIFGDAVRFFAEAPVPEARLELLAAWRDLLAQAVVHAGRCGDSGPVHLNCPFREPLAPGVVEDSSLPVIPDGFWPPEDQGKTVRAAELPASLPEHGWIIAGPAVPRDPEQYSRAVQALSRRLGWPVLADALSPLRQFAVEGLAPLTCYDAFLRNAEVRERVRPSAVIQLGDLPTSKLLRAALHKWQLPTWIIDPAPISRNAVCAPACSLLCRVEELNIPGAGVSRVPREFPVYEAERRARAALDGELESSEALIEPRVACTLIRAIPPKSPVFVASSMPVRDAEFFWPADSGCRRIYFNRGANGIDGTLSTALGVADACQRPAVLYTGELALLHDTNGMLAAASAFRGSLTIVCINNHGGGIFEHLPIAAHGELFEQFFATPQQVDFRHWSAAYGVDYHLVTSLEQLRELLGELPARGVRLLEVRTDRKRDAAWRQATFATAARAAAIG